MSARNLFFDPSRARGPRRTPDVGADTSPADEPEPAPAAKPAEKPAAPWTVSALITRIKDALAEAFPDRVNVVGEISNLKRHGSGHMYFRLKDARTAIDAAMFKHRASRLRFTPEDGMEVVAEGRVDVYDVRGQLQLYVEQLLPKGAGALELAFRQLREKLQREGLFDPAVKQPIPAFPRAVGVVTSPTGAAVRDIRRTLARRWPAARVYLVPALVQGEAAAPSIVEALRLLDANASQYEIDTILLARGGGSLEDLWAFNEEPVARAIFTTRTPIISGVGHEVDVTIADLVADARAATPTAAAEMAVPDRREVDRLLTGQAERLERAAAEALRRSHRDLDFVLRSAVFRDPASRIRVEVRRADELSHRLGSALRGRLAVGRNRLEPAANRLAAVHPARLTDRAAGRLERIREALRWALGGRAKQAGDALAEARGRLTAGHPRHLARLSRQRLDGLARRLEALSYRSVLRRGYTVTRAPGGEILRSAAGAAAGAELETEFHDGRVVSRIEKAAGSDKEQNRNVGKPRGRKAPPGPSLFDGPLDADDANERH